MFQQVVSYVAGTSVLRQYDVGEQVASAGLWKIYAGTKKTTGQKVAIFMFEKKFIDNTLRKGYERKENEKVYQVLKREATQLSRLRHPSVLEVVEAVEESRTVITFATEPILASLSNLLGNYDNLSPVPDDIKNFELDELEIQKGLLQVGKGLQFCHNDAKIVHSNLVPEAIFVNVKGDWKIGGYGFSNFFNPDTPVPYEYPDYDARIPCYAQKNYDYMAPEYVLDENFEVANDMFALGCLIYTVHSKGKPPMENHNSIHNYRKNVEQLSSIKYDHLPYHLHEVMFHLITRYPSQRMTASEFQTSKYFDNILVSTVKFFESFPEKSKDDKANFMKGLIRILPQFPERVLLRKILPCLLQEIKDHSLLPFTLPNIFFIAQKLPPLDFSDKVLIPLKPVFAIPEPMQNMILCLDKIELFQQKTSLSAFKEDVMPLIYNALETKTPAIQEKVLRVIPTIIDSLDLLTIKSSLFPRIQNLFVHTTILSIKVTTLVCLHFLVKSLDNFTMTEKLIPLLKGIKTKEPSVMITTLSVYEEMGKNVEKDIMATEILPQLWKMSIVPTLNIDQFQKFMQVIKVMSMKVEEEHSKQLQDIRQIDETVKNIEGGNEKNKDDNSSADFEKLVGVSKGSINNIYTNGKRDSAEVISDIFDTPYENSFSSSRGATPPITPHRNSLSSSVNSFSNNRNNTSVQPPNGISSLSQSVVGDGQSFNRSSTSSINFNSPSISGIPSLPPPKSINQFTGTSMSVRPSTNPRDLLDSIPSPTSPNRPHSFGQTSSFGLTNSMTVSQSSTPMRTLNNLYTSTPTLNSIALQPKSTNFDNHINQRPPSTNFNNHMNSPSLPTNFNNHINQRPPSTNFNNHMNSPSLPTNFNNNVNPQPQILSSLNHGGVLQPNTRPSMLVNNNSGDHKKPQADLTMFDPYS